MAGGRVRGGISRVSGLKDSPHDFFFDKKLSASDDPLLADIRAGGENTHTAQTTFVTFLHLQFSHSNYMCKSRLWHLHFIPQPSGLCFVFCAQTFLNPVGVVPSPCVLRRQYSEKEVVVCPYHIPALRTSSHSVVFAVTEDIHLSHDHVLPNKNGADKLQPFAKGEETTRQKG